MLIILAVQITTSSLLSANFGVSIMYAKLLAPAMAVLATLAILAAAAPTGKTEDGARGFAAAPEAIPDAQKASPDPVLVRKELDDDTPEPGLVRNAIYASPTPVLRV